jgi:hypothetical protein
MNRNTFGALAVVGVFVTAPLPALAQRVGDEVSGTIQRVSGSTMVVDWEGRSVSVQISSASVWFSDGGDRRNFPNATSRDLQPGMGVAFVYENPVRKIQVNYVPPGMTQRSSGATTRGSDTGRGSGKPQPTTRRYNDAKDREFDARDADRDQLLSLGEYKAGGGHPGNFENLDRNSDGYLTRDEFHWRER